MQNSDETIPTRPQTGETDASPVEDTHQTEITQLTRVPSQEEPAASPSTKRKPWLRRVLGGLGIFFILVLLGGLSGFFIGQQDRIAYQERVVGTEIADQFVLGLIDLENGRYENARVRFEYILDLDPSNAAAAEQLTKAIVGLSEQGAVPTPKPANQPTATPDTRNRDQLYQDAQNFLVAMDWDNLLLTLDSLRKADISFNAVQVDGMYYLAYRNRGVDRILLEGNLEGGIFDINRAGKFGPIDVEAQNLRHWAEVYITGVSFWEINWEEVVNHLSQVATNAPGIIDANGLTAQMRLETANAAIAEGILERARREFTREDWCDAYKFYQEAQVYVQLHGEDATNFEVANLNCFGAPETETPAGGSESTSSPPAETPTP